MAHLYNVASGVLLAKTSPAFLHANSTSHTWVFSAIAELIDNAYDPDVHASLLRIDVEHVKCGSDDVTCMTFTDNGAGMTPEKLLNMLSFGYCEKIETNGYKPVGQYGNGFKSGSMRIGKDAMVFTKNASNLSVGMLSQTFLEAIKAETILVPILSWDRQTMKIVTKDDTVGSLRTIRAYSIFKSTAALLKEFDHIMFESGTRIIIYNLKRGLDGKFELDFESDHLDMINSEHHEMDAVYRPVVEYTPEYKRSLREYCSILFLKPRMKIVLRDKKIKSKLILHSLKRTQVDTYKPRFLDKPVKIVFGFSPTQDYGIIFYHRNRLIKAYEKVGCQKTTSMYSSSVVGVVGVVEADFLEPIHNKQEFDKTDRYNTFINALGQKLNDYREFITRQDCQGQLDESDDLIVTGHNGSLNPWTWAQCDRCNKWRRLPPGFEEDLPEVWFCYMNRDPAHNRCDIDEEPEDEDAIMQQSAQYSKILKKQKNLDLMEKSKRRQEKEQNVETNAIADLEHAKLQLEEAQKREAEQLRIIQMLERQNRQWKEKQQKISDGIMSNSQCMADLNDIARKGSKSPRALASHPSQESSVIGQLGKRKGSAPSTELPKAKRSLQTSTDNASYSLSDSDDDDKEALRTSLVVKFPETNKQKLPIIVIDDSDSNSNSSVVDADVKPNIQSTNDSSEQNERGCEMFRQLSDSSIVASQGDRQLIGAKTLVDGVVVENKPPPNSWSPGTHPVSRRKPKSTESNQSSGIAERSVEKYTTSNAGLDGDGQIATQPRRKFHSPTLSKSLNGVGGESASLSSPRKAIHGSHGFNENRGINSPGKLPARRTVRSPEVEVTSTTRLSLVARRCDVAAQTDDDKVFETLTSLRTNVLKLLKTIVPTLDDFGNLEFVDSVVIEMVRVSDSAGSSADVKQDESHG